jgi:hypothetical protein
LDGDMAALVTKAPVAPSKAASTDVGVPKEKAPVKAAETKPAARSPAQPQFG